MPGFLTCVSRTHGIWAPMLTNNSSLHKKDLCARMKVAQDEFFRGPARLMPRYAVTTTYGNIEQKRFSVLHIKKKKVKVNFIARYRMRYTIYIHTSKCKRLHNRPYNACLWKPVKRSKVCMSKQLRFVANAETVNGNQALQFLSVATYYFLMLPLNFQFWCFFQRDQ